MKLWLSEIKKSNRILKHDYFFTTYTLLKSQPEISRNFPVMLVTNAPLRDPGDVAKITKSFRPEGGERKKPMSSEKH